MTHIELRDILLSRVGWKQPTGLTFADEVKLSESGRFFQDEHPVVSIQKIKAVSEKIDLTEIELNELLQDLKKRAIIQVIGDTFEILDINENFIEGRTNLFDDCISKRMAINIGELVLNSTRSNREERITKEQQQMLFFELNGNSEDNNVNPHFPTFVGLKSRYGACIERLRDITNQDKALDSYTNRLPNYYRDGEDFLFGIKFLDR